MGDKNVGGGKPPSPGGPGKMTPDKSGAPLQPKGGGKDMGGGKGGGGGKK